MSADWKDKLASFAFSVLLVALLIGAVFAFIWYENHQAAGEDAWVEARMVEMQDKFGQYAESFRHQAEDDCAYEYRRQP
jgi:hypothetical protein